MKPFNYEECKSGKPVVTRNGLEAKFLHELKGVKSLPLVFIVADKNKENLCVFTKNGFYLPSEDENIFDLFMKPEKKSGWFNVIKYFSNNKISLVGPYETKEIALSLVDKNFLVDTVLVEWED